MMREIINSSDKGREYYNCTSPETSWSFKATNEIEKSIQTFFVIKYLSTTFLWDILTSVDINHFYLFKNLHC